MAFSNKNIDCDKNIIHASLKDLNEDFEILIFLLESNISQLKKFLKELKAVNKHIHKDTFQLMIENIQSILNRLEKYISDIRKLKEIANDNDCSLSLLHKLIETKDKYFDLIRTEQSIIGSLITSTDWQSPSYLHSIYSMAGRQTGKIIGTINDYKRDQHLDEKEFEKSYLKEYIDAPFKFTIKTYMTQCGMAAFTTIFNFLLMEKKIKGKVLMGKSEYFEIKELIRKTLCDRLIEIEEPQTGEILQSIQKEKPSVIFLDSLCNSSDIAVPDIPTIVNYLIKKYYEEITLVIDNTCLSTFLQPMKMLVGRRKKITLLMFESLNKYLQFGMDRVTGGMIVAYGHDVGKLFKYREHLGTNIVDNAPYMIPPPNRKLLEMKLKRHHRNASLLALSLQQYLDTKRHKLIEKIVYPGLPNHPSFSWTKNIPFQGSFFNISFREKKIHLYQKFLKLTIEEARKNNINLVAGTSFGLPTTRIYLTSTRSECGEPFVRISVGTENLLQVNILKEVFRKVMDKL